MFAVTAPENDHSFKNYSKKDDTDRWKCFNRANLKNKMKTT